MGRVGNMALQVRFKIYETVVVPTVFSNIETWGVMQENEVKELESIQYKILRGILEQKMTTPYWGIIAETGIWPVRNRTKYKKIMLFHNIVTSDEKRLVKEVIEDQIRKPYKGCWGESVIEICRKYDLKPDEIKLWTKQKLKKEIKEKIRKDIEKVIEIKKTEMSKLRFTDGKGKKEYLDELEAKEAMLIMRASLNMLELKGNYRSKYKDGICDLCGEEEESTEHLFECKTLQGINSSHLKVEALEGPTKEVAKFLSDAMEIINARRHGLQSE